MDPVQESQGRSTGRVAALVFGAIIAMVALCLTLAGVALLLGLSVFDEDGFLTSPSQRITTDSYAIASEPLDMTGVDDVAIADDPIRLRLTLEGEQATFVGVAPADEAAQLLDDIAHAEVDGDERAGAFGGDIETTARDGGAPTGDPVELLDWEASSSGSGEASVTWEPTDGEWVVIAMNADGSAGLDVRGRIGADVPFLGALAWTMIGVGVLLGLGAAAMIVFGARSAHAPTAAEIEPVSVAAIAGTMPASVLPVRVRAAADEPVSRWLWLVKWALLIPHYIVLAFLWAAFVVVTIVAWFAIVITARYPRSLFDFNAGVLRWSWRVGGYSYGALATDRYPPFSLGEEPDYPVRLELDYPERLSRGLPFVKWVLALPHILLLGAAAGGIVIGAANQDPTSEIGVIGLLVAFIGLGLLFTGRRPMGLFDFLVGLQRWSFRVIAYVALMTDRYPPFRLDQGGDEPVELPSAPNGGGRGTRFVQGEPEPVVTEGDGSPFLPTRKH